MLRKLAISLSVIIVSAGVFAAGTLNVGLFTDIGSSGSGVARWAELFGASRDVTLTLLSGQMLRDGGLKKIDVLVMPGESGPDKYETLREDGVRSIRDFIINGGKYLGNPAFVPTDCGKGKAISFTGYPDSRGGNRETIGRRMSDLTGRAFVVPELKPPHSIPCGTVRNVRDLGGWKGLDGRPVKMGQLYRTGCFNNISRSVVIVDANGKTNKTYVVGSSLINDANRNFMIASLGIRTEIDLRNGPETRCMTGSPLGDGVKWEHHTIKSYSLPKVTDGKDPEIKKALAVIMDESRRPAAFHCALGKDRTGTIAMLVLGVLGVSEADICSDYVVTHKGLTPVKLQKAIDQLKSEYPAPTFAGNCEKYFQALGFTSEQIADFRNSMLEAK